MWRESGVEGGGGGVDCKASVERYRAESWLRFRGRKWNIGRVFLWVSHEHEDGNVLSGSPKDRLLSLTTMMSHNIMTSQLIYPEAVESLTENIWECSRVSGSGSL